MLHKSGWCASKKGRSNGWNYILQPARPNQKREPGYPRFKKPHMVPVTHWTIVMSPNLSQPPTTRWFSSQILRPTSQQLPCLETSHRNCSRGSRCPGRSPDAQQQSVETPHSPFNLRSNSSSLRSVPHDCPRTNCDSRCTGVMPQGPKWLPASFPQTLQNWFIALQKKTLDQNSWFIARLKQSQECFDYSIQFIYVPLDENCDFRLIKSSNGSWHPSQSTNFKAKGKPTKYTWGSQHYRTWKKIYGCFQK